MNPDQDRHSCPGKVRYTSRRLALTALRMARLIRDYKGKDRESLHEYLCQHCGGWHLGRGLDMIPGAKQQRRKPKPPPPDVHDFEDAA